MAANTKRLRAKHGWTQDVLAEKAGLEVRYIQEIERAKTNMTLAVLVDLAAALGVDPRAMLKEAELSPARPGRPRNRGKAATWAPSTLVPYLRAPCCALLAATSRCP